MFENVKKSFRENGIKTVIAAISIAVVLYTIDWSITFFSNGAVNIKDSIWIFILPSAYAYYVTISKLDGSDFQKAFWKDWNDFGIKTHLFVILSCIFFIYLVKWLIPYILKLTEIKGSVPPTEQNDVEENNLRYISDEQAR